MSEDVSSKSEALNLEQFYASIPDLFRTHQSYFVTNDESLRAELSEAKIQLTGYTFICRKDKPGGKSWLVMSMASKNDQELIKRQKTLKEAFSLLPMVPADAKLMSRAGSSEVSPLGVWALIAGGVTDSGKEIPPLLVYPEGFSPAEAVRVFLRVQEMIQNQVF